MAAAERTVEDLEVFIRAARAKMNVSAVAFAINMVDMLCSSTEDPEVVFQALRTINSVVVGLRPEESTELHELACVSSRCIMGLMKQVSGLKRQIMARAKHDFNPRKFLECQSFHEAIRSVVVAYLPNGPKIKEWIKALPENQLYGEMGERDTYLYALELLKSIEGGRVRGDPWRKKLDEAHNEAKEPNPKRSRAK